ncbi:hemerythrin domain-containing protein [Gloeobacter kilaueensis]|uniref:Hemerythrin HHE cation binding domain protein n=1 Tax=Gloeobacter kilaueensis (strain ATCC BAA-2537 / CCAP 1431/1 / ULC 316 / JS1) TaxID=1183438 RepID=U5QFI8_GLOK1|nr:hemerythrin domain-containing protein [Gloeobacter kilaueensis]AGY56354.1 hemerythrin HHE cation binding domain protein [Gloeobacter kilaueensis JS1]
MVPIIADEKRQAIAVRLADIKATQEQIIKIEEQLLTQSNDAEIRKRLSDFIRDDRKNLTVIDNAIIQYGVKGEARPLVYEMGNKLEESIQGDKLSAYDKFSQLELLKHAAAMAGITLHKAAQVVGADIDAAIAPLNTVNFENRSHQEQLKGILEILGTRELTGQDPDQGLWARVQDSLAALTGVFGSVTSRGEGGPDMKVTDYVHMDHQKVSTLFAQIQDTNDPDKQLEFFNQLYGDLSAHAHAEEQTWYADLKRFDDSLSKAEYAYQDQAELEAMLEEVRRNGIGGDFKARIAQLQDKVQSHVNFEEAELFAKLRQHFSDEQLREMGKQFQMAKSRFQDVSQQQAPSTR